MEITKTQSGEMLEVKIRGRLDGYWADDLRRALLESVREGAHHIQVDLAGIDYVSSVGLGTLLDVYQHLAGIHGSFAVINPSKQVRKLLELSGVDKLLMVESGAAAARPAPALQEGRRIERNNCTVEVFDCAPGAKLTGRVIGRPDLLQSSRYRLEHCLAVPLPENTMAIGLGALGDNFDDCRTRFGEFLAAAGAAAYQPTDGSGVPDHMASAGTFVPSVQMLYGVVCEGAFSHTIHFQQKKDAKPVTLSDLAETALDVAGVNAVGMALVAESAGLLGAWLRKSPALESGASSPFAYPGIREWLSFASERAFHRSMVLAVGVATRSDQEILRPFLRPLWREPFPAGHFHGASFSYRPLKKGETDLKKTVTTLFAEESLQGVLHLLSDDREAEGTGQSEFVRGACWVGPIAGITQEHGA